MDIFGDRSGQLDGDDPRVRDEATPLAVERVVSWIRIAVCLSGTVGFPLVAHRPGMSPRLAYTMLAIGWVYSLAVAFGEPQRRFPVLVSTRLTTTSDVVVSLLWLAATGGAHSSWTVSLYATIVTASLRLRPRDIVIFGAACGLGYVLMLLALGQLEAFPVDALLRVFYMLVVALLSAIIARERFARFAARVQALDLTQEVAQVGSWEWTVASGALEWSPELRRIFGVSLAYEPTFETYIGAVHPDDRAFVQETIQASLANGQPLAFDHRIVLSDGRVRWLQCRGRVIVDGTGKAIRMIGSSQDVTESRALQEEVLVGRKLASLGTLASGIAHEINNPLAYVATNLALARRDVETLAPGLPERERLATAIHAGEDGCRRVAEIVRGLKMFSRTDEQAARAVELQEVAEAALAIAAHEITQRASLVRDYRDAPAVLASETRLVQVVLNLVVNAAQAIAVGARGADEIRLRIDRAPDGRALLEVTDTGSGIAPEHLERIFDPFFTTKPLGVGMGLGLSICHGIVQDLDGEIVVETHVGRGSKFTVLLPAAPADANAAVALEGPKPAEAAPTARTAAAPSRMRILVIDDEASYARSLRLLLGIDHDVTTESDPTRALARFAAGERFDIVLCDLMMAGMSGMDLHEALAARHPQVLPRVVFLTGGATNERARAFLARSDVRHLEKPVELPLLEGTIRAVVQDSATA